MFVLQQHKRVSRTERICVDRYGTYLQIVNREEGPLQRFHVNLSLCVVSSTTMQASILFILQNLQTYAQNGIFFARLLKTLRGWEYIIFFSILEGGHSVCCHFLKIEMVIVIAEKRLSSKNVMDWVKTLIDAHYSIVYLVASFFH